MIMSSFQLNEINIQDFTYVSKNNQNYHYITLVSRENFYPKCNKTFIELNPFISNHNKFTHMSITKTLQLLKEFN